MVTKNSKLSRRNFLLAVGAGGAASAAAIVAKTSTNPSPAVSKGGKRGYQETAHVNNYYRTAKV